MRIAFLHHTFMPGSGIDGVIMELATRMQGKGHQVTVITNYSEYSSTPFPVLEIPLGHLTRTMLSPLTTEWGYLREMLVRKFDVVVGQLYPMSLLPLFPTKLPVKSVVVEWGMQPVSAFKTPQGKAYAWWLDKMNLWADRRADLCIAGCNQTKERLDGLGIKATRMNLYGVNMEMFRRDAEPIDVPVTKGRPTVLFVGRSSAAKKAYILVRAVSIIGKTISEAVLVLVGRPSPYSDVLRGLVKRLGLENNVFFAGLVSQEDLVRWYARCDVFAVASPWEGFLIPEPMAMGKPMVAFDAPPHRETVEDGVTGRLVKELTPEAFARAITDLLRNKREAQSMGEEGFRKCKRELDYRTIADKFEKITCLTCPASHQ